ncbi:MAG: zinc ribbon domain-containing protein [bacterium]
MPTYEYECRRCGRFEVFASIKQEPLKTCPNCRENVKMCFGEGGGFLFKGGGFYITDYRSPEYKKKLKEENKPNKVEKA